MSRSSRCGRVRDGGRQDVAVLRGRARRRARPRPSTAVRIAASGVRRSCETAASSAVRVPRSAPAPRPGAACSRSLPVLQDDPGLRPEGLDHLPVARREHAAGEHEPVPVVDRAPGRRVGAVPAGAARARVGAQRSCATTDHGARSSARSSSRTSAIAKVCGEALHDRLRRVLARQHRAGQRGERGRLGPRPVGLRGAPRGEVDHGRDGHRDHHEHGQREHVLRLGDRQPARRRREEPVEAQVGHDARPRRRATARRSARPRPRPPGAAWRPSRAPRRPRPISQQTGREQGREHDQGRRPARRPPRLGDSDEYRERTPTPTARLLVRHQVHVDRARQPRDLRAGRAEQRLPPHGVPGDAHDDHGRVDPAREVDDGRRARPPPPPCGTCRRATR